MNITRRKALQAGAVSVAGLAGGQIASGSPRVMQERGGRFRQDVFVAAVLKAGKYRRDDSPFRERYPDVDWIECPQPQPLEAMFDERVLDEVDKRYPHGIGLKTLIRDLAHGNGWNGKEIDEECLSVAMSPTSRSPLPCRGYAVIREVWNHFMFMGSCRVEQTWRTISRIKSVEDFVATDKPRDHERKLPNGIKTYGIMGQVCTGDINRDDLGAITQLPANIGRMAGLKLNYVFWQEFLSNIVEACANDQNQGAACIMGSGSRLSLDGLIMAEGALLDCCRDDKPIGAHPIALLIPTSLVAGASEIYSDKYLPKQYAYDATDRSQEFTMIRNIHRGKFEPVVSRYIGNSNCTGYTTTGYAMIGRPDEAPIMEVSFLNGQQPPAIESIEVGSLNDGEGYCRSCHQNGKCTGIGLQLRGYNDFGVRVADDPQGVWSTGC